MTNWLVAHGKYCSLGTRVAAQIFASRLVDLGILDQRSREGAAECVAALSCTTSISIFSLSARSWDKKASIAVDFYTGLDGSTFCECI